MSEWGIVGPLEVQVGLPTPAVGATVSTPSSPSLVVLHSLYDSA